MFVRRFGAVATATVLALGLAACGDGDGAGDGAGMKIGIKFDQPGLGLKEGANYTGFDTDVARYIAKELGTAEGDIQWVQAPTPQRETLIETGQVDLVVASYSITDKRKEKVSFAGPYLLAGQDLLVRTDETAITGPETLEGKTLCSVTGSTPAQNVKDKYPGVQLQEFATYSECVSALISKAVDAVTTDNTILAGYASQAQFQGKVKLVGKPFSEERIGVGFKKGDTDMCNKVTDALKKLVSSGEWQKLIDKHLTPSGFKPMEGNPPTPDACA